MRKCNIVDSESKMTNINDDGKSKKASSEEGEEYEEDDAAMKDPQATHRIYQQ